MSVKTDWLPGKRELQLAMAKNWITILKAKGDWWGVTDAETVELSDIAERCEPITNFV